MDLEAFRQLQDKFGDLTQADSRDYGDEARQVVLESILRSGLDVSSDDQVSRLWGNDLEKWAVVARIEASVQVGLDDEAIERWRTVGDAESAIAQVLRHNGD